TFYANLRVDARAKPTAEKPAETKPGAEKPTATKPATEKPSETKSSANWSVGRLLVRQILFLLGIAFLPAIGQAVYYRNTASWHAPPADSAPVTVAEAKKWGETI